MEIPQGFRFAGVACGVKPSGRPDLAVVAMDQPGVMAGVYTQNVVCAASIDWNRAGTPTDGGRGVVVNSGNANACTGQQGEADNRQLAEAAAAGFGGQAEDWAVLSTGIIGVPLPMEKLTSGFRPLADQLGAERVHFEAAAEAILTTDKHSKIAHRQIELNGQTVRILGMAKGAGMIGPNMATMLAVVCCDAMVTPDLAQEMVQRAAAHSFNRISVEGHTSTNDALLLLMSGSSGVQLSSTADREAVQQALDEVCLELAKLIPADGEGASRLIEIQVTGAESESSADRIARTIAASNLVKTAVTGADPNWGRIVSAAGYSGVSFSATETSLAINDHSVFRQGVPVEFDDSAVSRSMRSAEQVRLELCVGSGPGEAMHWTSDLTVDYVRFNSEYTT